MSDVTCPSGWTRDSGFDSRFPYIGATYGTTGSGSGTSHAHSITNAYTSTASYSYLATVSSLGAGNDFPTVTSHVHTVTATIGTTNVLPPYITMYFCTKTKLDLENNLISIFTSTAPTGWAHFTPLDGKFPMGANGYGTTGGVSSHTHSSAPFDEVSTSSYFSDVDTPVLGTRVVFMIDHYHSIASATIDTKNNIPPYYTVNYAEASNSSASKSGLISMATSQPPLGWSTFSSADNRLLQGASSSFGSTGGNASHTHYMDLTTSYAIATQYGSGEIGFGTTGLTEEHTHTVMVSSSSVSSIPPYMTAPLFQRKNSLEASIASYPSGEQSNNVGPYGPTGLLVEGATNPIGVIDLNPEFSAIHHDPEGDSANYYQIQVATDATFVTGMVWDSGQTAMSTLADNARSSDISYIGSTLSTNGTMYYWRIKFWDIYGGEGEWSSTPEYFVMNTTPSIPTSLLTEGETNPLKVSDLTPEFSAIFNDSDDDTCAYYEIEVNTNSGFTGTVLWDTDQQPITIVNGERSTDISYAGTALSLNGATYYWRIRFWDNNGTVSSWSGVASFLMSAPPNAPTDVTIDGSTPPVLFIASLTPKFKARHSDANGDSAIYYEIEVNTDSGFAGTVMWDTDKQSVSAIANNTMSPEFTYAGTALLPNSTTYYFRIRFWDTDDNVSPWSATYSFVSFLKYLRIEGLNLEGLGIN